MLEVPKMVIVFMFHTFDADSSVLGAVCLVASVEIQRSCRDFYMGLLFFRSATGRCRCSCCCGGGELWRSRQRCHVTHGPRRCLEGGRRPRIRRCQANVGAQDQKQRCNIIAMKATTEAFNSGRVHETRDRYLPSPTLQLLSIELLAKRTGKTRRRVNARM